MANTFMTLHLTLFVANVSACCMQVVSLCLTVCKRACCRRWLISFDLPIKVSREFETEALACGNNQKKAEYGYIWRPRDTLACKSQANAKQKQSKSKAYPPTHRHAFHHALSHLIVVTRLQILLHRCVEDIIASAGFFKRSWTFQGPNCR